MPMYVCEVCLEESGALRSNVNLTETLNRQNGGNEIRTVVKKLCGFAGAVLGGCLGMLSGQPVVVGAAAAVGCELGTCMVGLVPDMESSSLPKDSVDSCDLCSTMGSLESCVVCSRRVCLSCRQLVMAEEEQQGRRILRHYEKIGNDAGPGEATTASWPSSGAPDPDVSAGYHLSEDAFEIDEKSGQLIPVTEEDPDESNAVHGPFPADEWVFDTASVSPSPDEWESSDAWSSMDQDVDSWEADSADTEGG